MKPIFITSLVLVSSLVLAQAPGVVWNNCLGGSGHEDAQRVIETCRGEIVSVGHTHSSDQLVSGYMDGGDLWVACMNSEGALLWQKCYGGTLFDEAKSVVQTHDRCLVLAGFSESSDFDVPVNKGNRDFWLLKIDSLGNIIWQTPIGSSGMDMLYDVVETADHGFLAVGFSEYADGDITQNYGYYDASVVRLDENGALLWEKNYGGSGGDYARGVVQALDGGFLIAGETASMDFDVSENKGFSDGWIFKIDSIGNLEWEKTFGGTENDVFYTITKTKQGSFIAAGETRSNDFDALESHGFKDAFLVCIDSTGALIWNKCYGGSYLDLVSSSCARTDGTYLFAGMTGSTDGDVTGLHGQYDLWLIALDSSGTLLWQSCYGDSLLDWGASINETSNGDLVAAGQTIFSRTSLTGNHGDEDTWVLRLGVSNNTFQNIEQMSNITLYPNPASTELMIDFSSPSTPSTYFDKLSKQSSGTLGTSNYQILDLQGRVIQQGLLKSNKTTLTVQALAEGVYVLKVGSETKRFEVVR